MAATRSKITKQELQGKYHEQFNPAAYLSTYYKNLKKDDHSADYINLVTSSLHRIFTNELPEGDSVLDLGCGPTMHGVISASNHYKTIVSADFLEQNRQMLQKWIRNEESTNDLTYVFKMVASLEKEPDHTKLEARVRNRINEVIRCDVTQTNPLAPLSKIFDAIVTISCYECVATDDASYKKIVANTANLLAPNGHLIVGGFFNCRSYLVGTTTFHSFEVTKELVEAAMSEAGLEILNWQTLPRHEADPCESYYSGMFVVHAKKISQ